MKYHNPKNKRLELFTILQPHDQCKCEGNHKHIEVKELSKPRMMWISILRFMGLWGALAGLYSATTVCPFCGSVGCPTGTGLTASITGIIAVLYTNWKSFKMYINAKWNKR